VNKWFALLLLLPACSRPHPRDYRAFTVTLDEASLSDVDVLHATAAVFEWQAMGVPLAMVLGACDGYDIPGGQICLRGATEADIIALCGDGGALDCSAVSEGTLTLLNANATVSQVAHELGHGMGLIHTGPGTVMCRYVQCDADGVTPADYQQWLDIRD
jgi:hypothetical protein